METSTKIIAALVGTLAIGLIVASRGGKTTADDMSSNPMGSINSAAFAYLTANANEAASVAINRDQVTGATNIQALKSIQAITQGTQELTAKLAESNNGVVNTQIQARTAQNIEASRASVAMTVAKYQYKSSKKQANASELNSILGAAQGALKVGGAVLQSIW